MFGFAALIAVFGCLRKLGTIRDIIREFNKATAVCVNLALDCVEGDIRNELKNADGEAAELLARLLAKLKTRRVTDEMVAPTAPA